MLSGQNLPESKWNQSCESCKSCQKIERDSVELDYSEEVPIERFLKHA